MIRLTALLTYAGALPFMLSAMFMLDGVNEFPIILLSIEWVATSYSILIISFMAGIHWGQYLSQKTTLNLFITSNAIALAGWFGLLLLPITYQYLLYASLFAALLWIDSRLHKESIITHDYFRLRRNVTTLVILSLLVLAERSGNML